MLSKPKPFMRDLKRIDDRLDLWWSKNIERWVIVYHIPYKTTVNILVVETKDNGFRQLCDIDLEILHDGDMSREKNKDHIKRVAEYMLDERLADRRRARESIRDMTKDNKIQLMQRFARINGGGKCNSAFRRINLASKGKQF